MRDPPLYFADMVYIDAMSSFEEPGSAEIMPRALEPDEVLVPGTARYDMHELELARQRGEVSPAEYLVQQGNLYNRLLVETLQAECETEPQPVNTPRTPVSRRRVAYLSEMGAACVGMLAATGAGGDAWREWLKMGGEQPLLTGVGSLLALWGLQRATKLIGKGLDSLEDSSRGSRYNPANGD